MSTTHEIVLNPVTKKVRFYTSVDNGSYIPSNWQRAIEIIYIQTGALTVTVESHTQKLTAGQCILINSNVVHSTQCTIPNTAIVFQIPLDFIETYIPQVRSLLFHLPEGAADPKERTKLDIFKNTLEKMQIANDMQPDGFLLRFNSLLFEVLFQLYHSFSTKVMHSDFSKKKKELFAQNPFLPYALLMRKEEVQKLALAGEKRMLAFPLPIVEWEKLEQYRFSTQKGLTTIDSIHFYTFFEDVILSCDSLK